MGRIQASAIASCGAASRGGRKGRVEAEGGILSGLYCHPLIRSSSSSSSLDLPDEDEQREL